MTKLVRSRLIGGIYYCVLDVTGGRIQAPIPASDVPPTVVSPGDVDAWLELHVDSQLPQGITPGQVSGMFVEVRDLDRQIVETAANVVAAQAKAAEAHAAIEAETAKKAAAFVVVREAVTAAEKSKTDAEAKQAAAEKQRDEAKAAAQRAQDDIDAKEASAAALEQAHAEAVAVQAQEIGELDQTIAARKSEIAAAKAADDQKRMIAEAVQDALAPRDG